jgi:hypothetical protein
MSVAFSLSAVKAGATVPTFCSIVGLNKAIPVTKGEALEGKEGEGGIFNLTGEAWDVKAKVRLVFFSSERCVCAF